MCRIMEDYAEKRAKNASQLAEKKAMIDVAIRLWDNGMTDFQQIANLTDLPLDEVKKLFEGKTA